MTALDKFIRLEAVGHWRESADAEYIEVIVSFGDATLQLTSTDDTPITHWALRAVKRVGTNGSTVIYSPDSQGDEVLVIDDTDMSRAITAVTREIGTVAPPNKRHGKFYLLVTLIVLGSLLSQSSSYFYRWAENLTSPARLQELSKTFENQLLDQYNLACQDNRARQGLVSFSESLFQNRPPLINITSQQSPVALALPNGHIYLSLSNVGETQSAPKLAAIISLQHAMSERGAYLIHTYQEIGIIRVMQNTFGSTSSPDMPDTSPAPIAADFIAARDHLEGQQIDTRPLQKMAKDVGIGLPIHDSETFQPFAPDAFTALQQYCQN